MICPSPTSLRREITSCLVSTVRLILILYKKTKLLSQLFHITNYDLLSVTILLIHQKLCIFCDTRFFALVHEVSEGVVD